MSPRDRLLAALRGDTADRVPLILDGFHAVSLDEIKEPAKRDITERVLDQTHFSIDCPCSVNRYLVTPPQRMNEVSRKKQGADLIVTTEIDTPKGKLTAVTGQNPASNTTWTIKYPVESLEDAEKMRSVPWELPPGLAPPDLSDVPADFARRGIVQAGISSPFVCVGGMMTYEYFLELCATELDLIRELTEQCRERILSVLDVVLSTKKVEYVWMGGCEWVTPPMASPEIYEELVQKIETKVIERIHAVDAVTHIHCHGNVRSTLEMVIERGGDFFEPVEPPPDGDITFAEAKALAAGRMTLGGNIEARVLENEDADVVDQAVRAAFEGGSSRVILKATAGPICALTPRMIENYNRMIDVWEELSPIAYSGPMTSAPSM